MPSVPCALCAVLFFVIACPIRHIHFNCHRSETNNINSTKDSHRCQSVRWLPPDKHFSFCHFQYWFFSSSPSSLFLSCALWDNLTISWIYVSTTKIQKNKKNFWRQIHLFIKLGKLISTDGVSFVSQTHIVYQFFFCFFAQTGDLPEADRFWPIVMSIIFLLFVIVVSADDDVSGVNCFA